MMRLLLSCELRQSPKLTLEERFFGNFMSLSLAICPSCDYCLSDNEILDGFSNDPYDFKTTCPKCNSKFLANLIIKDKKTGEEKEATPVILMCEVQTVEAMRVIIKERGQIGISYLGKNNRQLFYNMIRHWGSYKRALANLKKQES